MSDPVKQIEDLLGIDAAYEAYRKTVTEKDFAILHFDHWVEWKKRMKEYPDVFGDCDNGFNMMINVTLKQNGT